MCRDKKKEGKRNHKSRAESGRNNKISQPKLIGAESEAGWRR